MDSDNMLVLFLEVRLPESGTLRLESSEADCRVSRLVVDLLPDKMLVEFLLVKPLCREVRYLLTKDSFILFDPCGIFLLSPGVCRDEMRGLDGGDFL